MCSAGCYLFTLQFSIKVCFSATIGMSAVAAVFLLWPWTMTCNLDLWTWPR